MRFLLPLLVMAALCAHASSCKKREEVVVKVRDTVTIHDTVTIQEVRTDNYVGTLSGLYLNSMSGFTEDSINAAITYYSNDSTFVDLSRRAVPWHDLSFCITSGNFGRGKDTSRPAGISSCLFIGPDSLYIAGYYPYFGSNSFSFEYMGKKQ